jgi:hypothetical protein
MVRRGSTVRVRQRALQNPRTSAIRVQADLQVQPCAVGMEPFMELSRTRDRARRSYGACSNALVVADAIRRQGADDPVQAVKGAIIRVAAHAAAR